MKPGDTVTIYADPLTQTDPEGAAVLVRAYPATPNNLAAGVRIWDVQFPGEDQSCRRILKTVPE